MEVKNVYKFSSEGRDMNSDIKAKQLVAITVSWLCDSELYLENSPVPCPRRENPGWWVLYPMPVVLSQWKITSWRGQTSLCRNDTFLGEPESLQVNPKHKSVNTHNAESISLAQDLWTEQSRSVSHVWTFSVHTWFAVFFLHLDWILGRN